MGVFAPLTGVVGALQAMEAVKLLSGAGETLDGRLLLLDAKRSDWRTVRVKRDPTCAICSGRNR
ncbi:Molybdopterin-synthase adenylyltransferase [compost metagenome]